MPTSKINADAAMQQGVQAGPAITNTSSSGISPSVVGNSYVVNYPINYDMVEAKLIESTFIIELEPKRSETYRSNTRLRFFSEEEFVFSFMNLYNSLEQGKKFTLTSNGVFCIENVNSVILKNNINGIVSLLSPIYVLERAKELGYV